MNVRPATKEDMPKILELSRDISIPADGIIIVAEDAEGIKAFMNVRIVAFAEPMVSLTPFASRDLFDYVSERLKFGGHKILRAFIREKHSGLLSKLGFNRVFEDYQSFEKIL